MSATKRRLKAIKRREEYLKHGASQHFTCRNCGERLPINTGHFVPPGLGTAGLYICESQP